MQTPARSALLLSIVATLLVMAACGGSATPRTTTATPTPSSFTATPTPLPMPPSPMPLPPTASPSVTPTTYQAGLLNGMLPSARDIGSISLNAGTVTYTFSGWQRNLAFTIDFCDWPVISPADCFSVNSTGTTDRNGSASGSLRFPRSGTFAGWFRFNSSSGVLASGFSPSFSGGLEYQAALVTISNEPIRSSAVTVTNGTVHIQVNGASPKATYNVWEAFADSARDQIGVLVTDTNGDGAVDLHSAQARGLITLGRGNTVSNLLSGFVVP